MPGLEKNLFKHELISDTKISPAGISNNSINFKVSIFIVVGVTGHTICAWEAWALPEFS